MFFAISVETKYILCISDHGYVKKTNLIYFPIQTKTISEQTDLCFDDMAT